MFKKLFVLAVSVGLIGFALLSGKGEVSAAPGGLIPSSNSVNSGDFVTLTVWFTSNQEPFSVNSFPNVPFTLVNSGFFNGYNNFNNFNGYFNVNANHVRERRNRDRDFNTVVRPVTFVLGTNLYCSVPQVFTFTSTQSGFTASTSVLCNPVVVVVQAPVIPTVVPTPVVIVIEAPRVQTPRTIIQPPRTGDAGLLTLNTD